MKKIFPSIFVLFTALLFSTITKAQMTGDNVFLKGRYVQIGINAAGAFGSNLAQPAGYYGNTSQSLYDPATGSLPGPGSELGFIADVGMDGFTVGAPAFIGDYFLPGDPQEGWGIEISGLETDGYTPNFETPGSNGFSGVLSMGSIVPAAYVTIGSKVQGIWQGTAGGVLRITQTTQLDTNNLYFTMTVKLKNISGAPLSNIFYMRTLDPDNDVEEGAYGGGFVTTNTVEYTLPNPGNKVLVSATGLSTAAPYLGLGTKDCRAVCFICTSGLVPSDDIQTLWGGSAGSGLYTGTQTADEGIGLTFNVGTLGAGDSTKLAYAYILSAAQLDSALNETATTIGVPGTPPSTSTVEINACATASDTVTVSISNGDYFNWTWSPSTGLSDTVGLSSTIHLDSVTGGITYTVIGTNTAGGCSSDTFYVSVVGGSVADTAHNNGPLCAGQTLALVNTTIEGATYSWTGPNGFTSTVQNPVIPNVTTDAGGVYTVVVNKNLCSAVAFDTVSILPSPSVPTLTSNSPICAGNTLAFNATDSVAGTSFSWNGPGPFASTLASPTIDNAQPPSSGVYTVVASIGTCTATDTITAIVKVIPDTPTVSNNGPICSDNTLTFAIPGTTGTTYSWVGPNGFTSTDQNPSITDAQVPATGVYSVTATLHGCSLSDTGSAVVNQTPSVPVATNNTPVCAGIDVVLNATDTVAGVTYAWQGPGGYIDTTTSNTVTIPAAGVAVSGVYTVTAIKGACFSVSTTTVLVNPMPLDPIVSNDGPVCSGNDLTFTVPTTPGATYVWSGPDSFSSTAQNPVITAAQVTATGEYTVTVTLGPCSLTDSGSAVVTQTPSVPVAGNNSPICSGTELFLTSIDSTAGVSYSWSGPDGYTSDAENPVMYNTPVSAGGIYTVTATLGMCTSTAATTVVVNPTPAAPEAGSNSPLCAGSILSLTSSSDSGSSYSWVGPDSFATVLQNPNVLDIQPINSGIYTVTALLNGCSSAPTETVVLVHPVPNPPGTTNVTYCRNGYPVPLDADGINLQWYTVDTGGTALAYAPIPATDSADTVTYYVSQTVDGCESIRSPLQVIVFPRPTLSVSPVEVGVCPGDTVQYTATTTPAALTMSYHWEPSIYLDATDIADPVARPVTSQNYTVTGSDANGCMDTAYVYITVHPAALVDMPDSVAIYPGETYTMAPVSNCMTYSWFPPLGLSADNISNPVASPEVSTEYVLSASTEWGCKTEDSIKIYVSTEDLLAMPNAFSPGNGPNNELKVIKRGIATLKSFRIFNRWGSKVFETTDIEQGWDGTYNGTPQPLGVYVYEVEAVTSTGKRFYKQGNVTLLR